jgi:vesicle coat complex subunit
VAFVSKLVFKYLKEKDEDDYIFTEQRHNNLSIIYMFIKTLRDWMRKNKPMKDSTIHKFLKTYNGKYTKQQEYHQHKCRIRRRLKYGKLLNL